MRGSSCSSDSFKIYLLSRGRCRRLHIGGGEQLKIPIRGGATAGQETKVRVGAHRSVVLIAVLQRANEQRLVTITVPPLSR